MAPQVNLQEVHDTLVEIAFDAGKIMAEANLGTIGKDTKMNSVDIVTEVDRAVESMVSTRLRAAYPGFAFMGEETYQPGTRLGLEPTFVCDPIDGTTNFVHGFYNACISLGLAVDRVPAVGVVYNPFLDMLYTAVRGRGAFLRSPRNTFGKPLAPGEESHLVRRLPLAGPNPPPLGDLGTALVAMDYGNTRDDENFRVKMDLYRRLASGPRPRGGAMVHSLRTIGSGTLNVCTVATGAFDAYWEGGGWPWDVCAAWCILTEAGGIMVGTNPGDWEPSLDGRKYFAVRAAEGGKGQEELVEEFWSYLGGDGLEYSA